MVDIKLIEKELENTDLLKTLDRERQKLFRYKMITAVLIVIDITAFILKFVI